MLYCTNCGEKTSEKKICEKCEVKIDTTHNYCKWCGNALEESYKKCPQCKQKAKKESVVVNILCYIISAVFLFISLGMFGVGGVVSAICFILFAVLLFPVIKNIFRKTADKKPKLTNIIMKARTVVLVVLLVVGFAFMPKIESDDVGSGGSSNDVSVSDKEVITSESQALAAAKKYVANNSKSLEQQIASELGFKNFYSPDYATYSSHANLSSWRITVSGKMSGYVDNYNTDFKTYKFDLSLSVSEKGSISVTAIYNRR